MQQNNQDQDGILLDQLKNGNTEAFTTLYVKYRRFLMALAVDMLKDDDKARDVLQDFFIDFWHKKLFLHIDTSYNNRDTNSILRSYLYACVRNRCLNKITREKKFSSNIPDEPFFPKDPLESQELYCAVNNALKQKVPPMSSKAFCLRHYDQKSHKEIAAEMNTSIQTVKNQISTAVKILRNYFKPAHL